MQLLILLREIYMTRNNVFYSLKFYGIIINHEKYFFLNYYYHCDPRFVYNKSNRISVIRPDIALITLDCSSSKLSKIILILQSLDNITD